MVGCDCGLVAFGGLGFGWIVGLTIWIAVLVVIKLLVCCFRRFLVAVLVRFVVLVCCCLYWLVGLVCSLLVLLLNYVGCYVDVVGRRDGRFVVLLFVVECCLGYGLVPILLRLLVVCLLLVVADGCGVLFWLLVCYYSLFSVSLVWFAWR